MSSNVVPFWVYRSTLTPVELVERLSAIKQVSYAGNTVFFEWRELTPAGFGLKFSGSSKSPHISVNGRIEQMGEGSVIYLDKPYLFDLANSVGVLASTGLGVGLLIWACWPAFDIWIAAILTLSLGFVFLASYLGSFVTRSRLKSVLKEVFLAKQVESAVT